MASVNKAILIGNLGRDPEIKYTPSGQAVTNFSIATTERYKDKSGEMQERTTWHNIVAWGRQAEISKEYLSKGSPVYIEGRIDNRSYEDKEGNKRYISEVVVQRLQLLGRKGESSSTSYDQSPPPQQNDFPDGGSGDDDDLPF
ncbi:MAG: single-stranded DNA-binding protein [candidate division Zixibacteria bacterium]|nr:single-stranded DNA-binding protein [candidate division Zixibacteria bacterium]MBU1471769.1 single-stranded DNA-binding protein [candidate division Zixibacteria bacterium]MBU2625133.1 single-stranded DNA-binding protein [candidate division Zixibacteria bacterium]